MQYTIPAILRDDSRHIAERLSARQLIPVIIFAGAIYGGVMGSFGGSSPDRWKQIVYSAIKVPMLLGVSFAISVPSFFILNTLFGMRDDFKSAIRAVITAQAGLAIMLAALSPFVALWYASTTDYSWAVLFNGGMFCVATITGQILLRRYYKKLIAGNSRHRAMIRSWMIVYAFVAIQMAWVLRPFVGGPKESTTFFRQGAWGNAYVVVGELVFRH